LPENDSFLRDILLDEKCRNRLMRYEIRRSQFVHVKLSVLQKSGMLPVCVRRFLLAAALMVMVQGFYFAI
jgi:hypothetical protein